MRADGIELVSNESVVLKAALARPSMRDKFFVKAMVGLDAGEITTAFYGFGADPSVRFHNLKLPSREVVIRAVLNPDYLLNESYSDLRDGLYRAIATSRRGTVRLLFLSAGSERAYLDGHVIRFEVPHFSKIPELQITLRCDDAALKGLLPTELNGSDILDPLDGTHIQFMDSLSTMPHGVLYRGKLNTDAPPTSVTIACPDGNWEFTVDYAFSTGDTLEISSIENDKHVTVTADGSSTAVPIANSITPGSLWPVVFPRENRWHFPQVGNFLPNEHHISFYPRYWGL